MKAILVLMLALMVSACGKADIYNLFGIRKFAVGDCLIQSLKEAEPWEAKDPKYQVVELGKKKYRVKYLHLNGEFDIEYGHLWEGFYQKVPCK